MHGKLNHNLAGPGHQLLHISFLLLLFNSERCQMLDVIDQTGMIDGWLGEAEEMRPNSKPFTVKKKRKNAL